MRLSLKQKLTLFMTGLMILMVSVVLAVMTVVSSKTVTENTYELLNEVVRDNLTGISMVDGSLEFSSDFKFVDSGVYTIIYSKSGALLAGQPPLNIDLNTDFKNGVTQAFTDEGYLALDFWLPFNWEDGVWVRGVVQMPNVADVMHDMTGYALFLLPLMVVVAGVGAYLLSRSTFKPINKIIAAASKIGEGCDLSLRIGLDNGADEISRMGQAFDSMFERLEKSFEAEKQFTSDASHELRTPIAVILAECNEALYHAKDEKQYREALEVIERQAGNMSKLIQQLLQMTRLEQGTQAAEFVDEDLAALVRVICDEQPNIPNGTILSVDAPDELIAEFDITLISRLLQNLINNAVRYGKQNGNIKVKLYNENNTVYLSVEDDGIGIDESEIQNIWKRFYQADKSRSSKNGAGLGLTMVKQIAKLHNGDVTVKSQKGKGSIFIVNFPEKQPK